MASKSNNDYPSFSQQFQQLMMQKISEMASVTDRQEPNLKDDSNYQNFKDHKSQKMTRLHPHLSNKESELEDHVRLDS